MRYYKVVLGSVSAWSTNSTNRIRDKSAKHQDTRNNNQKNNQTPNTKIQTIWNLTDVGHPSKRSTRYWLLNFFDVCFVFCLLYLFSLGAWNTE
ncbi:MAG: hypothetical protein ABIG87_00715 [Patescibacteria group bacterium]